MPIAFAKSLARFEGECTVEEAIDLAEWLRGPGRRKVDLSRCSHLHAALVQTLLALRPAIAASFTDPILARWLSPLLPAADPAPTPSRRRKPAAAPRPEQMP